METKHTPGPWVIPAHDLNAIRTSADAPLAYAFKAKRSKDEGRANARLIAAAPDMLATLKQLQEEWRGNGWILNQEKMRIAVDAAITKAAG